MSMRIDPKGLPLPMQEQVAMALLSRHSGGDQEEQEEQSMNQIPFEERKKVYTKALITWGDRAQMIVAVEELAECQKEICKILRGGENFPHLAEEIADATIMLEQMRMIFNINDMVCAHMDEKVKRLEERLGDIHAEM